MKNDIISTITSKLEDFDTLGRTITIPESSKVTLNAPGYKSEFFTPTVELLIGIGPDHTARLIMNKEAWEALKEGTPIDITTLKEFKDKYL